jgi:thiamine biosynthesis lipoprotein
MTGYQSAVFQAMGTEVEVLAAPLLPEGVVERVQRLFESMEQRFSRFRPDSELSLLNLSAGSPFAISQEFLDLLTASIAEAEATGGLFDPLVLPQLQAAGYRESFDSLRDRVQVCQILGGCPTYRDIEISGDGTVTIPAGSGLDFGGFAKGWTVDQAARLMPQDGNWCINAGGDLLAQGGGPDGYGWIVGVEDPLAPGRDVALLRVCDCAVATSSTRRRRWATDEGFAHHLIDPRTGRPSETDLASVTVVSSSVARAEVEAKRLILLGSAPARAYAFRNRLAALFVDDRGSVTASGAMEDCSVI